MASSIGDRTPQVTVVTTAYNAELYLADAVESIRAQTFRDWEYILVDDASDDATGEMIEHYARQDPRIRAVRRQERGGPYVAANQGFRQARGRLVARLDADDVSLPHRLERQLAYLRQNPSLRACATNVDLLVDGRVEGMSHDALPLLPGALKWRACVREMPMPSTTLMERAAWEDVGGFRELPLSQDLRMWCELARRRWLGLLDQPLVRWRRHAKQLSTVHGAGLQEDLAHEVLHDHLAALDGAWDPSDVYRLRWAAFRPVGLRDGRRVLSRFEELWQSDETLDGAERSEMSVLMQWLRARFLRVSAKEIIRSRRLGRALVRLRQHVRG